MGEQTMDRIMILIAGLLLSVATATAENDLPPQYRGVWQPTQPGVAPGCKPIDFDIRMTVRDRRVDFIETRCTVAVVGEVGPGAVEVRRECSSEGTDWVAREKWSAREENGVRHLFLTDLDDAASPETTFGLCWGSDGAFSDPEPQRYCYRDANTDFTLTMYTDLSAEFRIDSVQGNMHMCNVSGHATPHENGFRYSETIDGVGECALSIEVDDAGGLAFQDPQSNCKRHYCGHRAHFDTIALPAQSRISCE
jgi:hypothetical protein